MSTSAGHGGAPAGSPGSSDNLQVAVRVRPLMGAELTAGPSCVRVQSGAKTLRLVDATGMSDDRVFNFDCVQDAGAEGAQGVFFQQLGVPMVAHSLAGFNVSIFAYGQTGSGKSWSMHGATHLAGGSGSGSGARSAGAGGEHLPDGAGFIPRYCAALFAKLAEARAAGSDEMHMVEASYFQIYCERVYDLLAAVSMTHGSGGGGGGRSGHGGGSSGGFGGATDLEGMGGGSSGTGGGSGSGGSETKLRIREHADTGPYVEGLSWHAVDSYAAVEALIRAGNMSRAVASTNMNAASSRSHALFTLRYKRTIINPATGGLSDITSKISLIDLAGSERVSKTGAEGERLKEAGAINKSLSTLGLVISALAKRASGAPAGSGSSGVGAGAGPDGMPSTAGSFVPYRESVLTWLLKDSLGGNAKTCMIATVSPSPLQYEETLSTLRYAERAKMIRNHAVVNEDANVALIRQLREELTSLRAQLAELRAAGGGGGGAAGGGGVVYRDNPELLAQVEMLKMKNVFQEQLLRQLHSQWEERLRSTSEGLRQHEAGMRGLGVGVAADDEEGADEGAGGAGGEDGDADEWGEADWGLEGEGAAAGGDASGAAAPAASYAAVVVEEAGEGEEDDWGLGGGDGGDGAASGAGAIAAAPATPGQAPDAATAASTARTGGKPGHRRASLSGTSSRATTSRGLPILFLRQADSQLDRQIGFPLPGDGFASVGSAADNQIRLTSAGILQHHCTISCETASAPASAPSSEGQGQGLQPGGMSFLLQPEGGATVYVNGNKVGASAAGETSSPAVPSPAFSSGSGDASSGSGDASSVAAGSTGGSSMLSLVPAAPSVRLRHGDRIIFGDLPVVLSFEWPAQVAAACGADDASSAGALSGAGAEPVASRAAAAVAWSYDMAIGEWRAGGGAPNSPSQDVSLGGDADGEDTAAFSYSAALDLGGLGEGDDDEWGLGAASGAEGDVALHGSGEGAGDGAGGAAGEGAGEVDGLQTVMAELGLGGLGEDDVPVATASLVDLLGGETDTLAAVSAAEGALAAGAAEASVASSLAQRLEEAAAPAAPAAEAATTAAPAAEEKKAEPAAAAPSPAQPAAASLTALERLQRHVQRQVRCQDSVLLSLSDPSVRGRLERRMRHLAALVSEANSLLAATGLPLRLSRRALWLPGGAFSMASAGRRPSAFGGLGGAAGALNAAGSGLLTWERLAQEQDVRSWDLGVSLWHSTSDSGDARRGAPGGGQGGGSKGSAAAPVAVALIDERSLEAALDELRAQYGLLLDNAGALPTVEGANSARGGGGGGLSALTPSGGPEGVQRGLILSLLRRCCAQLRPGALTDAGAVVPTTQGSTMPSTPPPVVTLGSCVVGLVSGDEASISPSAAAAAAGAAATAGEEASRGPLVLFDSQRKASLSTSWGAASGALQLRVRGERAAGGGNAVSVSVGAPSIVLPAGQGAGDAGARLIVRCQVVQPQWSALPPVGSSGDAANNNSFGSPQAVKPANAAGAAAAKWSQWQFVLRRGKEVAAPAGAAAPSGADASAADASALAVLPLSHAEWLLESEIQDAPAPAPATSGDGTAPAATTAAPTGAPAAREVRLGFAGGLPVGWALRCIVEFKPGEHTATVAGALAAASASPARAADARATDGAPAASPSSTGAAGAGAGEEPVVLTAAALGSALPPSTSPFLARLLSDCARPPPVCVVPSLRYADALSRGLFEPPAAVGGLLAASPFVRHTHPAAYALPSWNPARSAASGFGVGSSRLRLTVLADVMGGDLVQLLPARLPGVAGAPGSGSAPSSPDSASVSAASGGQSTRSLLDASAWGAVTPLPVLRLPREEDSGPRVPGAPPIVSMEPVFVVPPGTGPATAGIIGGYGSTMGGAGGSFGQQLFVAVSVMQLRDGSPFALETCLHAHVTDVRRLPVSSTLATPDAADVTVSIAAPQEGALPFIQHRDPAGRALRVLIRLPPPRQPPASGLPSRGPVLETLTDCLASETPRGHRVYLRLQLGMTVRGSSNTVSFARWLALETLTPAVRSGSAPHPLYPAFSGKRDASLLAAPPKDAGSAPGTPMALAASASAGSAADADAAAMAAVEGPPPIVPHPMWSWYQRSPPALAMGGPLGSSGSGSSALGGAAGYGCSWAPAILGGLEATPFAAMTAADVWARVYALYRRCDVDVSRRWEAAGPTSAPAARAAAEQLVSLARNQALTAFGSSRISAVCAGTTAPAAASAAAGSAAAASVSGATPGKGGAESAATSASPDRERAGSASASSSSSGSPWDSLIPPPELSVRVPRCDAVAVSRMGADKAGYLSKGRARLGGSVRRYWVLQPPFLVSFQTAAACDTNQRPDAVVHLMEIVSIADDRGPLGLRRPALPYAPGSDVALGLGLGLGLAGASAGAGADSALPDNAGASALDDLAEVVPLSCLTDGDMDASGWPPYATAARATGLLGSALGAASAYSSSGGGSAAAVGLASFFASAASPRRRMLVMGGGNGSPAASPTSAGGGGALAGGDGMPAPVSTSPSFSITHRPLGGGPEHTRTLQAPSVAEKDSWLKALLLACERSTRLGPW